MKRLGKTIRPHLDKARDSALLAVEIYNKPAVSFKSAGYITLMIIAWTALFHAIFFKQRKKPYRKGQNGRFLKSDGDYTHWQLAECLKEYYGDDTQNPVRKNLDFFIPLRNQIEHRHLPQLDANIFGECQAMLLNFDAMVAQEFGEKFCLRESLSFSLQLFPSSLSFAAALKQNPAYKQVKDFIENFRSSIEPETLNSGKYAFKAFLVQVANHQSADALPIQFVRYDKLTDEQKQEVNKLPALIKFKYMPVANADKFKPSDIVKMVQAALGNPKIHRNGKDVDKFNTATHTRCWRKYTVRPPARSEHPEATQQEYCVYDSAHKDYLYTQAWVDFLAGKMNDELEYNSLFKIK